MSDGRGFSSYTERHVKESVDISTVRPVKENMCNYVRPVKKNMQLSETSWGKHIQQDWLSPVYSGRLQCICWNSFYTDTPVHWCTIRG